MGNRASTSRWRPMPHGVRLTDVPKKSLDEAARALGVAAAGTAAKIHAITAVHADRDQVKERLVRLPPLCWLVLEVLVDAGGSLPERELVAMVRERVGAAPGEVTGCVESLRRPLFVAQSVVRNVFGGTRSDLAVLDTVAATLTPLVRGLTLPHDPPRTVAPAQATTEEREILALATLTAHRRLRVNRDLYPNRSAVKTLVKNLVIDVDRAQERFACAHVHGLLAVRLEAYVPVLTALRAAAARGLSRGEAEATIEAWLPESGWVPLEQFVRACWRRELDGRAKAGGSGWVGATDELRRELGPITGRGIEVAEHQGHTWVRRRSEPLPLGGDGHVTPNLEVFLGPAAHPSLIVTIGLGAELVSVDRVLTFRLSPASVRAGLGVGLTAQELLEALERVGPHGSADNVRQSVVDFARQARFAELRPAIVLKMPAVSADAFCAKYRNHGVERVTSEVVLASAEWDQKELERCLEGLGVYVRDRGFLAHAEVEPADASPRRAARELEPPNPLRPDPDLVSRFAQDRKGDFATSREAAIQVVSGREPTAADAKALAAHIRSGVTRAPASVHRLMVGAEELAAAADDELDAWCAGLDGDQRLEVRSARGVPLLLLPYLALLPEWRAKARQGAQSLGALLEAAMRLGRPGRHSKAGESVLHDAGNPTTMTATGVALERAARDLGLGQLEDGGDDGLDLEGLDDEFGVPDFEGSIELPPRGSFPSLDARRIAQVLERAISDCDAIFVKLRGRHAARVQVLLPEDLRTRAGQKILLATDLETDEARVVPVSDIESVLPFD